MSTRTGAKESAQISEWGELDLSSDYKDKEGFLIKNLGDPVTVQAVPYFGKDAVSLYLETGWNVELVKEVKAQTGTTLVWGR